MKSAKNEYHIETKVAMNCIPFILTIQTRYIINDSHHPFHNWWYPLNQWQVEWLWRRHRRRRRIKREDDIDNHIWEKNEEEKQFGEDWIINKNGNVFEKILSN